MFIGGNDIRDARDEPDILAALGIIKEAVASVEDALDTLASAGAQYILVANAPDIGIVPETTQAGGPLFSKRATWLSRTFNRQLRRAVRRIERKFDVNVIQFNTFRTFRFIVRNGAKLGFINTEAACFFSLSQTYNPECPILEGTDPPERDFDSFIYFDEHHPTARVHEIVGQAMAEAVKDEYSYEYQYGD